MAAARLWPARARLCLNLARSRSQLQVRSNLSIALQAEPALEADMVSYPDTSIFESVSEEYTRVSTHSVDSFTPLTSSETLVSLVSKGDFKAAESLRREIVSNCLPITHDIRYLRAARHAITGSYSKVSAKESLDAFEAWLSLVPDRSHGWHRFHQIRQKLFWSMHHLNLDLVYRFGVVLASKGYYFGSAAMQVISTLARYAQPSVVENYLHRVEDASRDYHMNKGTTPPPDFLAGVYSRAVRTVALAGKGEAALRLISIAHSRGICIPDFTLNFAASHATDQKVAIDRIRTMYPSWTIQDTTTRSVGVKCESVPVEHTTDIAALAVRLRSLRAAIRSPCPPSPHALHSFITSYQALGRTRALSLLRSLAYRHSPKSASTWALTEMLHHRSRREFFHLLFVFSYHFHLVGVPQQTLLSLTTGAAAQQARRKHTTKRLVGPPYPMSGKLWPSAYHTALAWEAVVLLSPATETKRLYALLLSLVRRSRQPEPEAKPDEPSVRQVPELGRLQLPADMYDAAHFSPFVSSWARGDPMRAVGVMRDMVQLGIEPSVVQWSMLARGYAQHDHPFAAFRILDYVGEVWERAQGAARRGGGNLSDGLLGAHTNALRGFVLAGGVRHAREVERRLVVQFGYKAGDRPATDAAIAELRALEGRL